MHVVVVVVVVTEHDANFHCNSVMFVHIHLHHNATPELQSHIVVA